MTTALPFSTATLDRMVQHAVEKVYSTMLSPQVELVHSWSSGDAPPDGLANPPLEAHVPMIVSAVGFLGEMSGVLYLYHVDSLASQVCSRFLGISPQELEEMGSDTVNDTMGEVANMVVGTFKNLICDQGYNCRLTLPSIVRGSDFSIETPSHVDWRLYRFRVLDEYFTLHLVIKPGE